MKYLASFKTKPVFLWEAQMLEFIFMILFLGF